MEESIRKQSIVFDLDHTICFPINGAINTFEKYGMAKPNIEVINKMQYLKSKGFKIKICTARRMLTHKGDLKKIIDDVRQITEDWLILHNVPYDELIFGKPYSSSYYVDDKAMDLNTYLKWSI